MTNGITGNGHSCEVLCRVLAKADYIFLHGMYRVKGWLTCCNQCPGVCTRVAKSVPVPSLYSQTATLLRPGQEFVRLHFTGRNL